MKYLLITMSLVFLLSGCIKRESIQCFVIHSGNTEHKVYLKSNTGYLILNKDLKRLGVLDTSKYAPGMRCSHFYVKDK